MPRPGTTLEFPDFDGLAEKFRQLPRSLASAAIGAGVRRAMKPAENKLKETTPVGPTGNLRRGVAIKVRRYTKTATAVAVVGYRKPHTTQIPKPGTKRRNKANDKTHHQFLVEYGTKERFAKGGILSKQKARRGRMPAIHPVEQASRASEAQVKGLLESEMKSAYEKALKQLPRYMAARAKKGRS